jgi:hypothetical protein
LNRLHASRGREQCDGDRGKFHRSFYP